MNKFRKIHIFIYLLLSLIEFDIGLTRRGFNKTLESYSGKFRDIQDIVTMKQDFDKEGIEEHFAIMDIVCAWYPRKADCIHKSFLGYKIVRKKFSIPVEIVIGIKKFPFAAHAWLVYKNMNFLNDVADTEGFKIIMDTSSLQGRDSH